MIKTGFVQRNFHGWGCLEVLADEAVRLKAKQALIITDPFLATNGTADELVRLLDAVCVSSIVNADVVAEPPLAVGENLVTFARLKSVDLVIGLGGGSALDLAKLVAALVPQQGMVADYLNLTGTKEIEAASLPKIMIPTTSGTGSEVTNISVLSLEYSKDVVVHDNLLADVVIVDPKLTVSVPPRVTAATGIDALTHAIESYVSINATPISEALSLQAIRLIAESLITAVNDGDDQAARTAMSYGSYLAGLAFFNAGCAAVHALAYPLGGQFHLPHGESNAVLLPYVIGYIRKSCQSKLKDIYQAMGYDITELSDDEASILCVKALQNFVRSVGIPDTLQAYDIPQSALDDLTTAAMLQTRLLARTPMTLERSDIFSIYEACHQGSFVG